MMREDYSCQFIFCLVGTRGSYQLAVASTSSIGRSCPFSAIRAMETPKFFLAGQIETLPGRQATLSDSIGSGMIPE